MDLTPPPRYQQRRPTKSRHDQCPPGPRRAWQTVPDGLGGQIGCSSRRAGERKDEGEAGGVHGG
jgi:hypothetical protein